MITFLISIIISIASGYCTVIGMSKIFTSAPYMIMFISSVIEIGRVVLVYDVHHYWREMPIIKKIPGILMLLIAMFLSGLGVFGFFANAYTAKSNDVIPMELQITQLNTEIANIQSMVDLNNEQINNVRITMNSDTTNKAVEKLIDKVYVTKALNIKKDLQNEINGLMNDNKTLNASIIEKKQEVTKLQMEIEKTSPTIAHLKYLAKLLGTSNDTAILIFIVLIMMVFDTLAMYLMIISDWIDGISSPKPKRMVKKKKKVKSKNLLPIEEIKNEINIDNNIDNLIQFLKDDEKVISSSSFMKSLSKTPMILQKLEYKLGKDSEIVNKLKQNLKSKRW
jgi:hypothetical protein